jgi:hypothetical protein
MPCLQPFRVAPGTDIPAVALKGCRQICPTLGASLVIQPVTMHSSLAVPGKHTLKQDTPTATEAGVCWEGLACAQRASSSWDRTCVGGAGRAGLCHLDDALLDVDDLSVAGAQLTLTHEAGLDNKLQQQAGVHAAKGCVS